MPSPLILLAVPRVSERSNSGETGRVDLARSCRNPRPKLVSQSRKVADRRENSRSDGNDSGKELPRTYSIELVYDRAQHSVRQQSITYNISFRIVYQTVGKKCEN